MRWQCEKHTLKESIENMELHCKNSVSYSETLTLRQPVINNSYTPPRIRAMLDRAQGERVEVFFTRHFIKQREPDMVTILQLLADIISIISIFIIAYGAIVSIITFVRNELKPRYGALNDLRPVRATLSSYLLLGIEVLIASLILKTILEPNYSALIVLGAIVAVRLLMSLFLNREIVDLAALQQKKRFSRRLLKKQQLKQKRRLSLAAKKLNTPTRLFFG